MTVLRSGLLLFALLALIPVANADAAVSTKKAIWGPSEIDGESQFPVYKDLGAGIYETPLEWDKIAVFTPVDGKDPEDTAYDWPAELDTVIDEAKANGIQVAFTVTGTADWAKGSAIPKAYGDFLAAAAKEYPSVRLWSIGDGKTARYDQLLAAGYKSLKAASARNRIIAGNGNKLAKNARYDLFGYNPSARTPPTAAKLKKVEATVKPHKLWLGPVELPTSAGGP